MSAAGQRLLSWYEREKRDLPWRRTADPYAVWVSEIMLQQTTVAAVIPRYERFLDEYPDVECLASALEDDVLAALQGLGYYRRFRAMKKAAEVVLEEHGGALPRTLKELMKLPGIGEYTAGAILSIAFNLSVAAVDGNVVRVVSRLRALDGQFETPARKRELGALVLEMMPEGSASSFNQALFDLGARICTPKSPSCETCPVRPDCRAHESDTVERYPRLKELKKSVDVDVAVALVRRDGRLLLVRRPPSESRMPGFWEFPEVWLEPGGEDAVSLAAYLRERTGGAVCVGAVVAEARHGITHHRLRCRLFDCVLSGEVDRKVDGNVDSVDRKVDRVDGNVRWVDVPSKLPADVAVTTITKKLWNAYDRRAESHA